jgi:hypothetical protein
VISYEVGSGKSSNITCLLGPRFVRWSLSKAWGFGTS